MKTPIYVMTKSTKQAQFDAGGELVGFAGRRRSSLSAGALYRKQFMNYTGELRTPSSIR